MTYTNGLPETYQDKIETLQDKLSCADTDIKELENKLAIALATKERDIKALDLLEKCCCSDFLWSKKQLKDREVSELVHRKLSNLNNELWLMIQHL